MMLLGARPTPSRRRCAWADNGNPLPRTSPARSQVPTKTRGSLSTVRPRGCWVGLGPHGFGLAARQIHAEPARLASPQRGIGAAGGEQLLVRALLDDAAAVEHDE